LLIEQGKIKSIHLNNATVDLTIRKTTKNDFYKTENLSRDTFWNL